MPRASFSGSIHQSIHQSIAGLSLVAAAIAGTLLTSIPQPKPQISQTQPMQLVGGPLATQPDLSAEEIGVDRVAVLAIALAGSAAIGITLSALSQRGSASPAVGLSVKQAGRPFRATVLDHAPRPLLQKLLRLLHEDRQAAARLLAQAELKYPGKSPSWYVEKVIFDLQRDRGRY